MIEFSEQIEELIEDIENLSEELDQDSKEQHISNVVETANLLDEEGLHGFWMSPVNHEQVLKSFDTVGAYELLDLFQSSQWCEQKSPDQELTETELSHLEDIESELTPLLAELPDQLDDYLEDE